MAVPADFTILDISGTFIVNKTLTNWDDCDKILNLQGVGWVKRKAIRYATITLNIKHYHVDSDDGKKIEKIDIKQTLTGGIPGTEENRTLDWEEREDHDDLFGFVLGKSRRIKAEELSDEWLREGWTEDTYEHGVVQAYAKSKTSGTPWVGDQTWGVELIDGKRRYARHVTFTGPKGEKVKTKMYYDYAGPPPS